MRVPWTPSLELLVPPTYLVEWVVLAVRNGLRRAGEIDGSHRSPDLPPGAAAPGAGLAGPDGAERSENG